MADEFDHATVAAEYLRLGYRHGWTFMTTPEEKMRTAAVAFVGLNPGGGGSNDDNEYQQMWDGPGNAYFREKWGPGGTDSGIQVQVKAWHHQLGLEEHDSWCAQLVPFRSPDWASLGRKREAVAFSAGLWRWALAQSPAKLLIAMGSQSAHLLSQILGGRHVATLPAGWGRTEIGVWHTPTGRTIVGMPHPSRYRLFGRGGDASAIAEDSFRRATTGAV